MEPLKGWKTLGWNVVVVMGGAALTYMAGVDWTQYLDPRLAIFIVAGVNAALRIFTTGPVGSK